MDQLSYSSMLIFPMYSVACNEAYKLNVSSSGTWFRRSFFCVCTTHIADKRYTHSNNEVLLHAEGKSTLSALYTRHRSRFNVSQLSERKDLSLSTRKIADLLILRAVLLESFNWENTQQTITNQVTVVIFITTNEKHPVTAVYMRGTRTRKSRWLEEQLLLWSYVNSRNTGNDHPPRHRGRVGGSRG